jgi:hypothetical protein
MDWNKFRSKYKGKGYTLKQLSSMYKKQAPKKSSKRGSKKASKKTSKTSKNAKKSSQKKDENVLLATVDLQVRLYKSNNSFSYKNLSTSEKIELLKYIKSPKFRKELTGLISYSPSDYKGVCKITSITFSEKDSLYVNISATYTNPDNLSFSKMRNIIYETVQHYSSSADYKYGRSKK